MTNDDSATGERLESLRTAQMVNTGNPHYHRLCRNLVSGPPSSAPVCFHNPQDGEVAIEDMIKGGVSSGMRTRTVEV